MDSFFEQIVKKKKAAKEWCIIVSAVLGALVLPVAAFFFLNSFWVIVLAGVIYGAWWLITNQNVEYEYCVTNGDMDVDQITAQRKRRRLVSVPGRKIESLLPYDATTPVGKYQRYVVVAPSLQEEGLWSFTYHSKKNGHTFVVFQPDERILRAFYLGLPKLVQMDTEKAANELGIDLKKRQYDEE